MRSSTSPHQSLPPAATAAGAAARAKVAVLVLGISIVITIVCGAMGIIRLFTTRLGPQPLTFYATVALFGALQTAFAAGVLRRYRQSGSSKVTFQFGLRHLFFVMTLVSIWLAAAAWQRREDTQRIQVQQSLEQALMQIIVAGDVQIDGRFDRLAVVVTRSTFSDADLQKIHALVESNEDYRRYFRVRALHFMGAEITDQSAELIAVWEELQYLTLSDTQITDRGLAVLSKSASLRQLTCQGPGISRDGVNRLNQKRPDLHTTWFDQ